MKKLEGKKLEGYVEKERNVNSDVKRLRRELG
jgi:hypothetical protein